MEAHKEHCPLSPKYYIHGVVRSWEPPRCRCAEAPPASATQEETDAWVLEHEEEVEALPHNRGVR